ncbi:MAG: Jag N-terminal domain-containing protein, partial [Spirochaetaceae bacterium]|nr:Jag N-terminal domain-containing protein [Spirochaetaceae bacterium]
MEFEGRTEREAVAKAAAELGSESFDVEVLEKTGGLFG